MRFLFVSALLLSSAVFAKPEYRIGLGMTIIEKQDDIEDYVDSMTEKDFPGLTGLKVDFECRLLHWAKIQTALVKDSEITKIVTQDIGKVVPGKLYGTRTVYHTEFSFTFKDAKGTESKLQFSCNRK